MHWEDPNLLVEWEDWYPLMHVLDWDPQYDDMKIMYGKEGYPQS